VLLRSATYVGNLDFRDAATVFFARVSHKQISSEAQNLNKELTAGLCYKQKGYSGSMCFNGILTKCLEMYRPTKELAMFRI
jgi:hypothetical protein